MRGATREPTPTLARVLSDAERAAWIGDAVRARKLLRLGERIASVDQRPELLLAAESVRAASAADRPSSQPHARVHTARLPRLRPLAAKGTTLGPARDSPPPAPLPRRTSAPKRSRRAVARGLFYGSLALALGAWAGCRPAVGRVAYSLGHPRAAVLFLGNARDATGILARGDARMAIGDSSGAVADYRSAAELAKPPGETAWEAGKRLARIPGQGNAAADALLHAYVLGIDAERWDSVAAALARAGRGDQAERVRRGVGR